MARETTKAAAAAVHHEEAQTSVPVDESESKITWRDLWDNRRVLGFCLLIYMLPVNFGYEQSNTPHLLGINAFLREFGVEVDGVWTISASNQQILNAAASVGIFVAAFITGYLSDILGRKKVIFIACVICCGGILVQYFANSIVMLFGGKLLATFGFGLGHSLGPVYVAELAPVKLRGICLALVNTMIILGQWLNSACVYGSSKSFGLDDLAWRIPVITQFIPTGILMLGLTILPESPSWLILKGRTEDAAKSFRTFHGPEFDVDSAMASATAAVLKERELHEKSSEMSWFDCFRHPNGRRTLIICMVYISQLAAGSNFISGYLTYYYTLAGVNNALGLAQMSYAIQLVGNMVSWPLVDRFGRRPLLVGGMMAVTAGLLIIGCIATVNNSTALKAQVAFMTLWGFMYSATLGAVAYAVGGETPSAIHRQKTYSINIMSATAVSTLVSQVLPYLINTDKANLGGKVCFVFMGPSVLMCIYLYFCLPEMKGRTYVELEEMFQAGVPARKFKGYVCHGAHDLTEAVKTSDAKKTGVEIEMEEGS